MNLPAVPVGACPRCGSIDDVVIYHDGRWVASCIGCDGATVEAATREAVVEAWSAGEIEQYAGLVSA